MPVLNCRLLASDIRYDIGLKQDQQVTARYVVETDDPQMGGVAVLAEAQALPVDPASCSGPLPKRYQDFDLLGESYGSLICHSLSAVQDPLTKVKWLVTVTWRPWPLGLCIKPDATDPEDPLQRCATVTWEQRRETTQVEQAYNETEFGAGGDLRIRGKLGPVENAARDAGTNPLYRPTFNDVAVIRFTAPDYWRVMQLNDKYNNTLNLYTIFQDENFSGFNKHCVRYEGAFGSAWQFEADYPPYIDVEVRLGCKVDPWYTSVVNAGYKQMVGGVKTKIKIPNDEGILGDPLEPENLNLDGTHKPAGMGTTIDWRFERDVSYKEFDEMLGYEPTDPPS